MNTTPASEPNRPGGPAPTAPGNAPLTRTHKLLIGIVAAAVLVISGIGFAGSYRAVAHLAAQKGFGGFARLFPIGVDAGIVAFLALDLLLTWLRIAFPLIRYGAWALTAATIAFNAVVSWPDPIGVGMHATIPLLFVIAVEAARHAVGRIAQIVADKHLEGPPASRWFLNPIGTFVLWRRQRLWAIRTWREVLTLERERRIYIGQLRGEYGRSWRRNAPADKLLILRLATKDGLSITDALELPEKEAEKRRATEQRIANEQQAAAEERRREQEAHQREQKRLDEEGAAKAEADRIANEREALRLEQERRESERVQELADAEHRAALEEIARQQAAAAAEAEQRRRAAEAEAEQRRQQEQLAHARAVAAEQQRAAEAARIRRENEEAAARAAAEKEAASRRAAEIVQRAASANASAANRPASASRATASGPANAGANAHAGSASRASATATSPAATSGHGANASASQAPATTASTADLDQVVEVFKLLKEQDGTAPSDAKLGAALGVSRSRAQQLRTLAVDAGHTELAKPVRLAS